MIKKENTPRPNKLGWISIYRKIIDNPIFDNPRGLKIWLWCLLKANRLPKNVLLGRQLIHLKAGQFIFGSTSAGEQLKMSKSTIHFWMNYLKVERYIERKTTNKYSIVTILNYQDYQTVERKVERTPNAKRMLNETNNKDNKEDKDILSKDNTNKFGNSDINLLIAYMKEKLGLPILDETEKTNRRYCWLAIKKFGGVDKVKLIIDAIVVSPFWSTKVTSFKTLYYKAINIISSVKQKGVVEV